MVGFDELSGRRRLRHRDRWRDLERRPHRSVPPGTDLVPSIRHVDLDGAPAFLEPPRLPSA
ncbi:MAG: hypothetical protein M0Z42_00350 [Actinomycetota bacterium]|nr:hypothetical protein [Actinomycetota bacterium]